MEKRAASATNRIDGDVPGAAVPAGTINGDVHITVTGAPAEQAPPTPPDHDTSRDTARMAGTTPRIGARVLLLDPTDRVLRQAAIDARETQDTNARTSWPVCNSWPT